MEDHPDLAKGYNTTSEARVVVKKLWEEISTRLNSNGPPVRNPEGWKKVWSDFKFHIKKKLKENKINISGTGAGRTKMHTFSAIEDSVIRIIDLQRAVEGTSNTQSFGDTILELPTVIASLPAVDVDDPNTENIQENMVELQTPRATARIRSNHSLLQEQVNIQSKFHDNVSTKLDSITNAIVDTNKTLKRLVRIKEKSYDLRKREMELKETEIILKENEIKLKQKSNLEDQKLKLQDLEIKKQKLELKAAKL